MVKPLQPPATEFTWVRVAHHLLRTLVANNPNMKDAIVAKVIEVHKLGSGMHRCVPMRVNSFSTGHLSIAISVTIEHITISRIRCCFECKYEALVGQSQPKPINQSEKARGCKSFWKMHNRNATTYQDHMKEYLIRTILCILFSFASSLSRWLLIFCRCSRRHQLVNNAQCNVLSKNKISESFLYKRFKSSN